MEKPSYSTSMLKHTLLVHNYVGSYEATFPHEKFIYMYT